MLHIQKTIEALQYLGEVMQRFFDASEEERIVQFPELSTAIRDSQRQNPWFVSPFVCSALRGVQKWLHAEKLKEWSQKNHISENAKPRRVCLVMAGNIPLVGFHDFMSVLITGNIAIVKLSTKDSILLPVLASYLTKKYKELGKHIAFIEEIPADIDAFIASGTNNTIRYFSYRYETVPNLLRGSRNSVAVLTGNETKEEIDALASDICLYFGLGCRSIAKVYLPNESVLNKLKCSLGKFSWMLEHKDWADNHRFQKAVLITRGQEFVEAGPVLFTKDTRINSPMTVVHVEKYDDLNSLQKSLKALDPMIQCVVGNPGVNPNWVPFGMAQYPDIDDYADRINTVEFLQSLDFSFSEKR